MRAQLATDHKTEIFEAGLQSVGFSVDTAEINDPKPEDVLIVWNRKPTNIDKIKRFEAAGCRVFVAENGYIGADSEGNRLICLALNRHLGRGTWFVGAEARYKKQNFEINPWRQKRGDEIVILGQRGIGDATDGAWAEKLAETLKHMTKRPIRIRHHPGKNPPAIEPDLLKAHAVVTWASAAAIKAIAFGIPCFHLMPGWVGAQASVYGIDDLEKPYLKSPFNMFHRLSWAQWTADEVANGKAFTAFASL